MITKFLTPDNVLFLFGIIKNYITEELIKIAEGVEVTLVGLNVSIDADSNIPAYKPIVINVEEENGYCIDSITVLMGEEDITSSTWNSSTGTISIPLVTNNINITIETHYLLTTTLLNLTLSWNTLKKGQSFIASFIGEDNNVLLPSTVNVTMGGADITDTAFRILTNTIEIPSVTGDVSIEGEAVVVPSGYVPLMYLTKISKGYTSSILTNYVATGYTSFIFDVLPAPELQSVVLVGYQGVTASKDPKSNPSLVCTFRNYNTSNATMLYHYGSSSSSYSVGNLLPFERCHINVGKGVSYENRFERTVTWSWNGNSNQVVNLLGTKNTSTNGWLGNVYGVLHKENNTIMHRYIPIAVDGGYLGYYELVGGTLISINNAEDYLPPTVRIGGMLTNCETAKLSSAETGTAVYAVIGSTWSIKLTPSANATFNSEEASISLVIGGVDVTNLTNGDNDHTPYVQYDSTEDTYTITIVNVPQEEIVLNAVALDNDEEETI